MRFLVSIMLWSAMLNGAASAQETSAPPPPEYLSVDLGDREQSRIYPLKLTAQNLNCRSPQDFRFDASGAPWISVPGEPVVRQVPKGGSKSINATMDFRSTPPGPVEGEVRVKCETCGFIPLVKNCRINDKILVLSANVLASPGGTAPAWPPLNPGRLPAKDPIMRGVGPIVALDAATVSEAMAKGKGPCDELVRQVETLRSETIDCSTAEAEVEAARVALANAEAALDAERIRRAELRAHARNLVSQYQAANAAANAAAARAEAAAARIDAAKQTLLNAFLQHTGLDPKGISLSPPPGMTVVGPGETGGRTPPYAQELPIAGGLSIFYVDDGGLWNPVNSSIGVSRLRDMIRYEIEGGAALLAAIAAAEAEAEAARDAADAARAEADALAGPAAEADAAAHGLAPLSDDDVSDAEARFESALAALEACRRRAAQLAATLAEAEAALKECEKLAAAQREIDSARQAIEEAEEAIESAQRAIDEADRARAAAAGADANSRAQAHRSASDANGEMAEAEEALDDARARLEAGDPAGASILAGGAAAAASRAKEAADQARQAAERGVQRMIEDAARTGRQLEAFFQWLADQGVEADGDFEQILHDLRAARIALETGDPSDLDLRQRFFDSLADALHAVGLARTFGVTASATGAGISAFAGILYAILEAELTAAARRVANDAFMQESGASASTLAYWVRKAELDRDLQWQDDVLIIDQEMTGSAKSYFIIRRREPGSRNYRYMVFRSSESGGVEYLGETSVS